MHRITIWFDDQGDARQVSVACLDDDWVPHGESTAQLGPFDEILTSVADGMRWLHDHGCWRAHQGSLL